MQHLVCTRAGFEQGLKYLIIWDLDSGLGFIRSNDRQRHEYNHNPEKRFICKWYERYSFDEASFSLRNICSKAAFTRRDLFIRHKKTACSWAVDCVDDVNSDSEQPGQRSKKARKSEASD